MTQHKFRTRKSSWSEIYLIGKERERETITIRNQQGNWCDLSNYREEIKRNGILISLICQNIKILSFDFEIVLDVAGKYFLIHSVCLIKKKNCIKKIQKLNFNFFFDAISNLPSAKEYSQYNQFFFCHLVSEYFDTIHF